MTITKLTLVHNPHQTLKINTKNFCQNLFILQHKFLNISSFKINKMVHPEVVKHGVYHSIEVKYNKKEERNIEMFIGRFNSDGKYHLLGYRPTDKNFSYLFPEETEINQDLGIVALPKNKKSLANLTKGESISIIPKDEKPYSVIVIKANISKYVN